MVGKDFFVHLVGIEFVPTNMTTFLKVALLATQITCPESKRVDGFSRMLVKGDLDRLKAKKSRGQVLEAEEFLTKKWTDVNAADLNTINKCKAFGRCCLRVALHLLQKEQIGRECKEYANLEAIGECRWDAVPGSSCERQPRATATATECSQLGSVTHPYVQCGVEDRAGHREDLLPQGLSKHTV